MKLEFTDERIKEYYEGGLHYTNDGEPIEVSESLGQEMLKKVHFLDDKQVPVFRVVAPENAEAETPTGETEGAPEESANFLESAEQLARNSRADLEKMAREAGLDGDSYTNKSELAQAIVAAREATSVESTDPAEG